MQSLCVGVFLFCLFVGAIYDETKVEAQIATVETATTTAGWLLWNARNYYPNHIFKK